MLPLPTFWPPLPNCPQLSEAKACDCAAATSPDSSSSLLSSAAPPLDFDAQLAAATARANTNEALFIAFLVLLLVSWVAIVLILYKQRQQHRQQRAAVVDGIALSASTAASPSGLESAGHTFNRTTSISHYDHTPPPPSMDAGPYAAPSLSSNNSDSAYSEAPRAAPKTPTNMYVPVTRAVSRAPTLTSVPSEDQYVDVPRYDVAGRSGGGGGGGGGGAGGPITTYVPVPMNNSNLSPRRATAPGLPPPIAPFT